jgi:quaternary ammonium compound-resistance protein SugE
MKPWLWVIAGGLFETVWAVFMKFSEGFTQFYWTGATMIFIVVAIYLLNCGFKRGVPVGGGYAVFVGVGGVGSLVMETLYFEVPLTAVKILFAAIIIIGIIGVDLTTDLSNKEEEKNDQES